VVLYDLEPDPTVRQPDGLLVDTTQQLSNGIRPVSCKSARMEAHHI